MCLKTWLCKHLCKPKPPEDMPTPHNLTPVVLSEIITSIQAYYPRVPLYISDQQYQTTTKESLQEFLNYDDTDTYEFSKYIMDCDDFSFKLLGNMSNPYWGAVPLGIMWVNKSHEIPHALNFFIDKDLKLWMVEPQQDRIYEPDEDWRPYLIII